MLTPKDENELAEAIHSAAGPFAIVGGGTRGDVARGTPLKTSGIKGITTYDPGALTIVAQAGTPLAEIETALASENQMLAFEPMDHRTLLGTSGEPTIGAVVAANISGPRRVQAGACRDFLLGVRFVDGQGDIIRNGGRVMKNVTGYDLARLQCGAHGTLGVLTEVGFKVLPRPEYAATILIGDPDHAATVKLMTQAMKTPYEVSGAARLPAGVVGDLGVVVLRLEGFEDSVKYRANALVEALKPDDYNIETSQSKNAEIWRSVRDVTPFADHDGDIWCLSIKPTDFVHLAGITPLDDMLVDWGCGRIWVRAAADTDVRAKMSCIPGHATLVRGSDVDIPKFHPEVLVLAQLAAGLREKFDPKGILNPGKMG